MDFPVSSQTCGSSLNVVDLTESGDHRENLLLVRRFDNLKLSFWIQTSWSLWCPREFENPKFQQSTLVMPKTDPTSSTTCFPVAGWISANQPVVGRRWIEPVITSRRDDVFTALESCHAWSLLKLDFVHFPPVRKWIAIHGSAVREVSLWWFPIEQEIPPQMVNVKQKSSSWHLAQIFSLRQNAKIQFKFLPI